VELEISLDETREQYNNVLRNSNSKAQQRKMEFLTRNLDQLTHVQKQLVEQNALLKKDVAIAERKLLARNERIASLETMLGDAQEKLEAQNQKFEKQLQAVRERLEVARAQQEKVPSGGLVFGRIAKPLRGGGGDAAARKCYPSYCYIQSCKNANVGAFRSCCRRSQENFLVHALKCEHHDLLLYTHRYNCPHAHVAQYRTIASCLPLCHPVLRMPFVNQIRLQ